MRTTKICTNTSFSGNPWRLEPHNIKNAQDALRQWELLKSAKYLDVHSDMTNPYNKQIRLQNYSFLDRLTTYADKAKFVSKFREFTMFPNLLRTSEKIDETFDKCLRMSSKNLNEGYGTTAYNVIDSGYDPTCSVALRKAFPGSDLDKGYIILEGNLNGRGDQAVVQNYTTALWEHLDQRLVSLNHPDTFPNIYTRQQVIDALLYADKQTNALNGNVLVHVLAKFFFGNVGETVYNANRLGDYLLIKASDEVDPAKAAKFNIDLSRILPQAKREFMKNFAFFIETVDSNIHKNSGLKQGQMYEMIRHSPFVLNSNVNQTFAWQERIKNGYLKSKLRHREKLEADFERMSTEDRFELIKDVIKSSSNDQSNPKFARFFRNDDDIAGRYRELLNLLR